jgi:hypothetical protein
MGIFVVVTDGITDELVRIIPQMVNALKEILSQSSVSTEHHNIA